MNRPFRNWMASLAVVCLSLIGLAGAAAAAPATSTTKNSPAIAPVQEASLADLVDVFSKAPPKNPKAVKEAFGQTAAITQPCRDKPVCDIKKYGTSPVLANLPLTLDATTVASGVVAYPAFGSASEPVLMPAEKHAVKFKKRGCVGDGPECWTTDPAEADPDDLELASADLRQVAKPMSLAANAAVLHVPKFG